LADAASVLFVLLLQPLLELFAKFLVSYGTQRKPLETQRFTKMEKAAEVKRDLFENKPEADPPCGGSHPFACARLVDHEVRLFVARLKYPGSGQFPSPSLLAFLAVNLRAAGSCAKALLMT